MYKIIEEFKRSIGDKKLNNLTIFGYTIAFIDLTDENMGVHNLELDDISNLSDLIMHKIDDFPLRTTIIGLVEKDIKYISDIITYKNKEMHIIAY